MQRPIISRKKNNPKSNFAQLCKKKEPRICIKRRLGGIGDVIMSLPSLKAIKKYYPNSYLVYATDTRYIDGALKKIVSHSPYVDKIIHYKDIIDRGFDLIADITTTGLNKEKARTLPKNRIDLFAEEIGIELLENHIPEYHTTLEEQEEARSIISKKFNKDRKDIKVVLIQARSNDVRRTWPLSKTQELINELAKDDIYIILCDWKNDFHWKLNENCFLWNGEINITAALVEQSDLVICPDSAVMHLAGSFLKPTIAIFGPIHPDCRCNHYPTVHPVSVKMKCSYCFYTPSCKKDSNGYMECMRKISSDHIYKKAINMLNSPSEECLTNKIYGSSLTSYKTDNIILVKRSTSGIGDLVMATNGIERLKAKYPGKDIHVAVQKNLMPILDNNPYIDKVIDISSPINSKRYFAILDISTPCAQYESYRVNLKKTVQKSRVEVFSEALETREFLLDLLPKFYLSEKEINHGKSFIKSIKSNKPKIAIALKSAELYRSYTHEDELIKLLMFKGFVPIILNRDTSIEDVICCGDNTIREAAAILNASDGIITVDTGWLHIAAALNKKAIAMFGPIDYRARCKQYPLTRILVPSIKCMPCWRNNNILCKRTKTFDDSLCMGLIKPNIIVNSAIKFFKEIQNVNTV